MNPGMPSLDKKNPCHAPAIMPITSAIRIATYHGRLNWRAVIAITIEANPATEPTDKSICPITITISIPKAKTNT